MTKARSLADLMADGNSLADGVVSVAEVSGAAPLASPSFTGDVTVTGTVDGRDVAADGTKLDGIEAGADVTDTANVVASLTAGSNITIAADGTIAGAAQYTHPTHPGDDASVDTGALSGATVISDLDFNITTDTDGHVTDANASVATRNMTLADLGYTGATNANYITNNNQLTNGAGYTTNVGDITDVTAGTNLTGGGSSGSVTVNLTASPNITSLNVGGSEVVSSSRALKNIASVDATTAASITAAGVGGAANAWTNLPNTYSFNYNMVFGANNSGWLNASTILTNMPNDFKYFILILKGECTAPTSSGWYGYFESRDVKVRLGSSSSSYTQFNDLDGLSMKGVYYNPVQYGDLSKRYGYFVVAKEGTPTIPQLSFFGYTQLASMFAVGKGVQDTLAPLNSLLAPLDSGYNNASNNGWNVQQNENNEPVKAFSHTGGTDYNYCAIRLENTNYASQNGVGGSVSWTVAAAYVPA